VTRVTDHPLADRVSARVVRTYGGQRWRVDHAAALPGPHIACDL